MSNKKKKSSTSSAQNNPSTSKSEEYTNTIIGAITLYYTDGGFVLIDHGNLLDVGLRVKILESALEIEKAEYDRFTKMDENGRFLS